MADDAGLLTILNGALYMLGDTPIVNIDEDTQRCKIAKGLWPSVRDALLRMHPWNCAIQRETLAPITLPRVPSSDFSQAYNIPADCIRILEIVGVTDYKIEVRRILCNELSLEIKYVYRNERYEIWDALLIQAAQSYMAMLLAYPITKSNTTREGMKQQFEGVLRFAKAVDAQEEPQDTLGDFPLIDIRSQRG